MILISVSLCVIFCRFVRVPRIQRTDKRIKAKDNFVLIQFMDNLWTKKFVLFFSIERCKCCDEFMSLSSHAPVCGEDQRSKRTFVNLLDPFIVIKDTSSFLFRWFQKHFWGSDLSTAEHRYTKIQKFCMCRLHSSYEGASDIVKHQEESIVERLRRDVTACESIVKYLEINLKSKVEKSSPPPEKNRAAELELILDSRLTLFDWLLSVKL